MKDPGNTDANESLQEGDSNSLDESVTQLLVIAGAGDRRALDRLFPLVYDQLRVLARARLRGGPRAHTLNTTALVHEAFIKLTAGEAPSWQGRAHFFAIASRAMRFVLISYARERNAQKRGGGVAELALDDALNLVGPEVGLQAEELLTLDHALEQLAEQDQQLAELVEMRFFGGMKYEEIAEVTGQSLSTVKRAWRRARAWLYTSIADDDVDADDPPRAGSANT